MPSRPGMPSSRNWKELCIPIALHGDGVSVANIRGKSSKLVDCISWKSLLAKGRTRMTTFLVWFCFGHLAKKRKFGATWPTFWRQFCLSLQALWNGTWPAKTMNGQDHPLAGRPLAGGYFALVYTNIGDLDWMAGHFQLNHPGSSRPCALCACTNISDQDPRPWTDCNNEPTWLDSCWTDEVYSILSYGSAHCTENPPLTKVGVSKLNPSRALIQETPVSRLEGLFFPEKLPTKHRQGPKNPL